MRLEATFVTGVLLAAINLSACACSSPKEPGQPARPYLAAREPLAGGSAAGELGTACEVHGKGDCKSGLCLQVRSSLEKDTSSARRVRLDFDCPEQFRCRPMFEGSPIRLCSPPAGWKPAIAKRGASRRAALLRWRGPRHDAPTLR